ncbi:hypothetical protein D6D26_07385 [Aureobasidium pullulans]|nr:hypothetical protein D6D26_07385 [Aureobasidium pullulans]
MASTSTKQLEDTLPLQDPRHGQFAHTLGKQWPIYTLVAFDDQELQQLESDINKAEDSTGQSVLITTPNLSNRTLRDIYEHHIQHREKDNKIHPTLFIVADQKDYQTRGVLVIDLQVMTDTSKNVIGVLRCGSDDADLYCANLEIGNVDFIDYKEEEQSLWGGDNPYENQRYFSKDPSLPAASDD